MFLKSLTLKGFKSFAETTTLTLEPGVTVVVGPNGSGKSNVVDAVGWVLGAQAPSTVRSSKMDDVIFAGTATKAPLGRAEVSLTIDNSSGLLPIEFTEVTITRTLFRSGDSEYAINGVPCRLLDVQELLSDTGVGRQRHIIISQGQIDAVLNARPEDRRLIIEEAAGVLKYRRRKEKAERRLVATEGNLTRLEDLRREVARELRPLARQADAARRHQGLADELRGLRIHLSGRDLHRLRERLAAIRSRDTEMEATERGLIEELTRADTAVLAAEAALVAAGGQDIADTLGRCESLREKARGLLALIAERRRRIERVRAEELGTEVVVTLEAEAAAIAGELSAIAGHREDLDAMDAELRVDEAALEAERDAFAQRWAESDTDTAGRAVEVRTELAALQAARSRASAELARIDARAGHVTERIDRITSELDTVTATLAGLEERAPVAASAVEDTQRAAERAAAEAERLDIGNRTAQQAAAAALARVETLQSALREARARAGVEELADIDGVVGTLLDVVDVDDGYQAAFESAAGEAIAAVVVRSVVDARTALGRLAERDTVGAVLALSEHGRHERTRPRSLPGTEPLRDHVRGIEAGVDEVLDVIVGDVLVASRWQSALDAVVGAPDVLVVTTDGGRFAPTGWRVATDGSGATGAALAEARARAHSADQLVESTRRDARIAAAERDRTVEAARAAQVDASRITEELRSSAQWAERLAADRDDARTEIATVTSHRGEIAAALERDVARIAELSAELPGLESAEAQLASQVERRDRARAELQARTVAAAARRSEVTARERSLSERHAALRARASEIEERLAGDIEARADAQARRDAHARTSVALERLGGVVSARVETLDEAVAELRVLRRHQGERIRNETEELERLRALRTDGDRRLTECRAERQRLGLSETEARVRSEQIAETIRVELDTDPEGAMAAPCPEVAEGVTPVARVRELERELRLMGTINPLAIAEYTEKSERHEFLSGQLDDVRESRRELNKVIRQVDSEIAGTFAAAYADVRENFVDLFTTLFPGGTGDLSLTDPEDPLSTGIEISARPEGKNVRSLSLLSGGERSLVALAFLFAVFRSRSSPFYVMDEVEAALDDVNLHRFLDLIGEFRSTAQLIIVSHQKRTMEAADALFGVTMQPGGSSRVVSQKV